MSAFVLQAVDKFLASYHIGHVAFLLFLVSIPAGIVVKSAKIVALTLIGFGGLFVIVPSISDAATVYSFFGLALMIAGPMAYTTASR